MSAVGLFVMLVSSLFGIVFGDVYYADGLEVCGMLPLNAPEGAPAVAPEAGFALSLWTNDGRRVIDEGDNIWMAAGRDTSACARDGNVLMVNQAPIWMPIRMPFKQVTTIKFLGFRLYWDPDNGETALFLPGWALWWQMPTQ